jgi:hypothetical protein
MISFLVLKKCSASLINHSVRLSKIIIMKHAITISVFIFLSIMLLRPAEAAAQQQTFDLATYTVPKTWKKQTAAGTVQFIQEDAAKGDYAVISVLKAVPGAADSKYNFDAAWETVVKEMVTPTAAPAMQPVDTENGWETQSGYAPFANDSSKGVVVLVTATCLEKMVNIVIVTNTNVYEKEITGFLSSVSLKKITAAAVPAPAVDNAIAGTWGISASDQSTSSMRSGTGGYISRQYIFNTDGTYSHVIKTFSYTWDKLLLNRESGTYHVNGDNLTVNPKTCVLETWSKDSIMGGDGRKYGTDKWGRRLSSEQLPLEKTTYQFSKEYMSGTEEWNLMLRAGKPTRRDGPFSGSSSYPNTWFYISVTDHNKRLIELPASSKTTAIKKN